jgi:thiamine pyrophosphate-dependent acetolactate synthase large subunit-like protein
MAATYGRHTGKAGVCVATLGPGATNFVTAAAYAQLGGMPMMMLTGQKPIKKSKQGRFQILDVVDMMKPITKYTHQLASADNAYGFAGRNHGRWRKSAIAKRAAAMAPFWPTGKVATGIPAGICAMDRSESRPRRDFPATGTPRTGMGVSAAAIPGRWAAPPAPAIRRRRPRFWAERA